MKVKDRQKTSHVSVLELALAIVKDELSFSIVWQTVRYIRYKVVVLILLEDLDYLEVQDENSPLSFIEEAILILYIQILAEKVIDSWIWAIWVKETKEEGLVFILLVKVIPVVLVVCQVMYSRDVFSFFDKDIANRYKSF